MEKLHDKSSLYVSLQLQVTTSIYQLLEHAPEQRTCIMSDSDSIADYPVPGEILLPPSSASVSSLPMKRKRDDEDEGKSTPAAKRKAKRAKKVRPADDADLDLENGINHALGRMDNRLLADYVAQKTKRFEGNLSIVDLEDKHIPGI